MTSLPDEAKYASEQLERHLQRSEKTAEESEVKVWADDVIEWLRRGDGDGEKYDVIFALDCAFHFSDRAEFIRLASKRLAPGGKLAFVDLLSAYLHHNLNPLLRFSLAIRLTLVKRLRCFTASNTVSRVYWHRSSQPTCGPSIGTLTSWSKKAALKRSKSRCEISQGMYSLALRGS